MSQSHNKWVVEYLLGNANDFIQKGLQLPPFRLVRICKVQKSSVVLGSAQKLFQLPKWVNEANIDVVSRRSGGGAVWICPDHYVWIDVFLPFGDVLICREISSSFFWLGTVLVEVLEKIGLQEVQMYRGSFVTTPWSSAICFSSKSPGEVFVANKKVVGISQRRTREGVLFQIGIPIHLHLLELSKLFFATEAEKVTSEISKTSLELDGLATPTLIEETFLSTIHHF